MLTLQSLPCNFLSLYCCTNSSITKELQDNLLKQHNLLIVEPIEKIKFQLNCHSDNCCPCEIHWKTKLAVFIWTVLIPAICSLLQLQVIKKDTNMILKARMVLNLNQRLQDRQETQISLTEVQIGY